MGFDSWDGIPVRQRAHINPENLRWYVLR
jgi:hypothetical protein